MLVQKAQEGGTMPGSWSGWVLVCVLCLLVALLRGFRRPSTALPLFLLFSTPDVSKPGLREDLQVSEREKRRLPRRQGAKATRARLAKLSPLFESKFRCGPGCRGPAFEHRSPTGGGCVCSIFLACAAGAGL